MKPICVPCQRFFRPRETGIYFTEMMPKPGEGRPKSGTAEPHRWQPYKIWSGDRWECEGCGANIISGVGWRPVSERHKEDFVPCMRDMQADKIKINDC